PARCGLQSLFEGREIESPCIAEELECVESCLPAGFENEAINAPEHVRGQGFVARIKKEFGKLENAGSQSGDYHGQGEGFSTAETRVFLENLVLPGLSQARNSACRCVGHSFFGTQAWQEFFEAWQHDGVSLGNR